MRFRILYLPLLSCGIVASRANAQSLRDAALLDRPPLCVHSQTDIGLPASGPVAPTSWFELGNAAVVLEYPTVYSVHTSPNPSQPLRSQPGAFLVGAILDSLRCYVDSDKYDFVLMYSLHEVPGWIHSGPRGVQAPAKNIGLPNSQFGQAGVFGHWPRLLLAPHMNSVELVGQDGGSFGLHSAMHEIGHAWNVFWAQDSAGPLNWESGDPVAWLAACCGHWSWNWVDSPLPGMMYSAPTQPVFNDFDLYAMGLMSYAEALMASYEVYEVIGGGTGPAHSVTLDDLIYSLSLRGAEYYEGDGRRIPATDPSTPSLTALILILKGQNETLTGGQQAAILGLAESLPQAWSAATRGRSALSIDVIRTTPIDSDVDAVLDCIDNCPATANPAQQDFDGDGLGDACDPCPHVAHPSYFDLDRVLPFTLRDLAIFQNCFSGPSPIQPGCAFVNFSGGDHIDLSDYLPLAELLTGNCD